MYLYFAVDVLLFLLRGLLSAGADFTARFVTSFLDSSTLGVVNVVRIIAGDASLDSVSLSFLLVLLPGDGVAVLFILFLNFFLGGVTVTTSEYTLFLVLFLDDDDDENVTFDSD